MRFRTSAWKSTIMKVPFSYEEAISRNIGWITEWEQQILRAKKIAIAGMGGVGGLHLLTLVRLGVGSFHIADFDQFEVANFNRQVGATMATVGHSKISVLTSSALDINPEAQISRWPRGIGAADIDAFLEGVDLYVDGLDFFVIDIRIKVFERCRALGIPAITAGPIGFGTGYIVFMPDGMPFEQYFRFAGLSEERQYLNFYMGLVPKALQRGLLVDPGRLNLNRRTGPSSIVGCQLCAGVAGAEAVKILLNRGVVRAAPYYHQFDAFRGKLVSGKLRWGNAGPLQRLRIAAVSRRLARSNAEVESRPADPPERPPTTQLEQILDLARWAPSGDNSQPWRFAIRDERTIEITIHEQTGDDIYDYGGGQPSLISAGMLLETIRIAASNYGRGILWTYRGLSGGADRIEVRLSDAPEAERNPLLPFVTLRSVDRRPYRRLPLNREQKAVLQAALGPDLEVSWFESAAARWTITRLNAMATDIRLRIPEAFAVHRRILDWDRDRSPNGIPANAIGLDRGTLKLMRWAMADWNRVDRMNRLPGATLGARLQMDYLPGLACGAHFVIRRRRSVAADDGVASLLRAGEALQRFWLTATQRGLALQPSLAPLCFAHYGRSRAVFTADARIRAKASALAECLDRIVPGSASGSGGDILFLGRIGIPDARTSGPRSIRRPLNHLLAVDPEAKPNT
jgi:sulfur-carrier protein adenylyltransferase/sulfurtransferase